MKFLVCLFALISLVLCNDPEVDISDTSPQSLNKTVGTGKIMVVQRNKDAYLTCVVRNKLPDYKVEWKYVMPDGFSYLISQGPASNDPFLFQVDTPSAISWRLKIQNMQVKISMTRFICQTLIGEKKYAAAERTIKVVDYPKIVDLQTDSDKTVKEGDPLSLRCNATGVPFPIVKWQRYSGGLLPSGGVEHADYVMDMGMATPDHRGAYKCTAQNEAGLDERIVMIQVKFKPRVIPMADIISQARGYRKDLLCTAEAFPIPEKSSFLWTKGGKSLTGSNYRIKVIEGAFDRMFSRLTIMNVQLEDFGHYLCQVSNDLGSGSATIELAQSNTPTPVLTGQIVSGTTVLSISVPTIFMLLCVCLLQWF